LCERRPPGGQEPCLTCDSCRQLDDPRDNLHPNVYWVQLGKGSSRGEESLNNQVNEALEAAKDGPIYPSEPHRNYKFIVVDEVQNLPAPLLQRFLYFPEAINQVERHNVRMIFSTMNRHRLNPDTEASFVGRTTEIPFFNPSYEELLQVAQALAPEADPQVHQMLSEFVSRYEGGYRRLISYLDTLKRPCYNLDPKWVRLFLGTLSPDEIDWFWWLCSQCVGRTTKYREVRLYFAYLLKICHNEPRRLLDQLLDSLAWILTQAGATPQHYEVLKAISATLHSAPFYPDEILSYCYGLPYVRYRPEK